jgi:hypothetical protein
MEEPQTLVAMEMRQQDKALVVAGQYLRVALRHDLGAQEVTGLLLLRSFIDESTYFT